MQKILFTLLGLISLLLGLVGMVLPVLPTVPFILLAVFLLSKGHPELHAWLRNHPKFGGVIGDWEQSGAIAAPVKKRATLLIGMSLCVSLWMLPIKPYYWLHLFIVLLLSGALVFIWTRPNAAQ